MLIDTRVSAHQETAWDQSLIRHFHRVINTILQADHQRRTKEVGGKIETILFTNLPLHKESWYWMKGWYKASVDCAPPPAQVTFERITVELVYLYLQVPPPGDNIPISVKLFQVEDLVPT